MRKLERLGVPAIKNLVPALTEYSRSYSEGGEIPALPDVAGVIFALDNALGSRRSALVKPLAGEGVPQIARGQTIIGLTLTDRLSMIADDAELSQLAIDAFSIPGFDINAALGAILGRELDNAQVVTDIDARRMHNIFTQGLRRRGTTPTSGTGEAAGEMQDYENHLFVPLVID